MNTRVCAVSFYHIETPLASIKQQWTAITHNTFRDCLVRFYALVGQPFSKQLYACPVFHRALTGYLSEDPERLQKRALRIIYPGLFYNQALEVSGLPTLFKRREEISSKLSNEVVGDPGHTLHKRLPPKNPPNYFLRKNRDFALPLCKTDWCKKSFIFSHVFSAE